MSHLGVSALRADTIHFWTICNQDIPASKIMSDWLSLGVSGQFPFPLATTKLFIDLLGLDVTHLTLRLPSALFGIAAVMILFFAGRRLGGVGFGTLLALMLAVNPIHIQATREAYFYAPLFVGTCLAFLGLLQVVQTKERLPWFVFVSNGLGFLFLVISQPTGLPVAGLYALAVLFLLFRRHKEIVDGLKDLYIAIGVYAVCTLPFLLSDWGLKRMLEITSAEERAHAAKALAVSGQSVGSMIWRSLTSFSWGTTPLRILFLVIILVLALAILVREIRKSFFYQFTVYFLVGGMIFFLISRTAAGALFEARYVMGLVPVYLAFLAMGMWRVRDVQGLDKVLNEKSAQVVTGVLAVVALGLSFTPALASARLTGKPTPYKEIVATVDEKLPQSTLVLVDRWFEPWNELKVHNSTNVLFVFTVPNEPLDTFIQVNWRKTATDFFERYPNAAYLEIAKTYHDVPEVGPWDWPSKFFSNHIAITNEAGMTLRNLGQALRGDFYASNTNRVIVELFYNTREDLFARAAQSGYAIYALYGSGWGHTKTQDYRDWRILEGHATLDVFNTRDEPIYAQVQVRGVTPNGSKTVRAATATHTFPAGEMSEWIFPAVEFYPGLTIITLEDDLWDLAKAQLMVSDIACVPVERPAEPSTEVTEEAAPPDSEETP